METLIAVFSGVAFLALIVYLWNSDSASKQDKHEAIKEESLSPDRVNEPNGGALVSSAVESEHIGQLQQKIGALKREHAEAFKAVADYRQKATANQVELQEAQASAARSSQRLVELEADNSHLQRRVAELESQQGSRQSEMASLEHQVSKLGACEQEVAILQKEKAELIEQLGKSEIENAANVRASLALKDLEAKQSESEDKLASLREENKRLLGEISELRSSLRDKIKTQLDGLEELYRNLTPRLN
jgi:chromosome segregation ATPase